MRIDDIKKEITLSERIEEERNKKFKENGIDDKIDKDLLNKRSFAHMVFQNPYLGIGITVDECRKDVMDHTEMLRIYERAIKENINKGKLKEEDFLFDNVYEKLVSSFDLNNKKDAEIMNDFLLATHGFVYINLHNSRLFLDSKDAGIMNFNKDIVEIEENFDSMNLSSFDTSIIDLDYCKERVDKIAEDFNLTNKEKTIYLTNIIVTSDIADSLVNLPKLEKIIHNSKDIDKDILDSALAYRLNDKLNFNILDKEEINTSLESKSPEHPEKIQKEAVEILQRNGLFQTLKTLSKPLEYQFKESSLKENYIDIYNDPSYLEFIDDLSFGIFSIDDVVLSNFAKNIVNDFIEEETLNGSISAKNALPDIINKNFQNDDYKAGERFFVLQLLTRPYYFTKGDFLDIAAASANLYPSINNFDLEKVLDSEGFGFSDEDQFSKWVRDYSEARLKYGASIIEVAGIKKRLTKSGDKIYGN